MKNVAVIPFYYCFDDERREITRKIFHHYANVMDERGDIIFIGVGSEGSLSRDIWREYHSPKQYVEYSQAGWPETLPSGGSEHIQHKFNFAIDCARHLDPERVWLIQSDDLISRGFFYDSDADMVGVGTGDKGGCYFWHYPDEDYRWWNGVFPRPEDALLPFCGGNIGYSRGFLDEIDWKPYTHGEDINIQKWALQEGRTFDARLQNRDGFVWWLVKGKTCINTWNLFGQFDFGDVPAYRLEAFLDYWETL